MKRLITGAVLTAMLIAVSILGLMELIGEGIWALLKAVGG